MNDRQRMSQLKTGNQNRAFSAGGGPNSSVLLYKAENKPWSEQSIRPYLQRQSLEALQKTMPFLNAAQERTERRGLLARDRALSAAERDGPGGRNARGCGPSGGSSPGSSTSSVRSSGASRRSRAGSSASSTSPSTCKSRRCLNTTAAGSPHAASRRKT